MTKPLRRSTVGGAGGDRTLTASYPDEVRTITVSRLAEPTRFRRHRWEWQVLREGWCWWADGRDWMKVAEGTARTEAEAWDLAEEKVRQQIGKFYVKSDGHPKRDRPIPMVSEPRVETRRSSSSFGNQRITRTAYTVRAHNEDPHAAAKEAVSTLIDQYPRVGGCTAAIYVTVEWGPLTGPDRNLWHAVASTDPPSDQPLATTDEQ